MTSLNWILQKNLTKPAILQAIKSALHSPQEIWQEVEIVPFSSGIPDVKRKDAIPVVYGSTTFMLNAFEDPYLRQGVFYRPDTFQMKNYADQWGSEMLNGAGRLLTLAAFNQLEAAADEVFFIRPNHDGKEFSGRVESLEELQNWSKRICALDLPDVNGSTEIWLAHPQKILKEWRLFIVDDEIVSASRYMLNGELNESAADIPAAMLDFAKARIAEYRLADIYVMDIAEIASGYKLIECNCFNGTGFYQHNIAKVVRAVSDFLISKMK